MTISHEVSRVKGCKWLESWDLTNLRFALALATPHTKLIPSSGDAHSPLRASKARQEHAGCLHWSSTNSPRTFDHGLLRLGLRPHSTLPCPHPSRRREEGGGGGLGEGPGDTGPSPRGHLTRPGASTGSRHTRFPLVRSGRRSPTVVGPSELVQVRDCAPDSDRETTIATEKTTSLNIAARLAEDQMCLMTISLSPRIL
jgi:hypothetical protein